MLENIKNLMVRAPARRLNSAPTSKRPLLERPSRDDVIYAFRFFLGREPENEDVINDHLQSKTIAELRMGFLYSEEFRARYRAMHPDVLKHPNLHRERQAVVFIHLQKTGGTSLRHILAAEFPDDRRCPVFEDKLHVLSMAELAQFDFFSGHFDISNVRFIPRDNIVTLAIFREPRARLISYYRFLKSHPPTDEFAIDRLIPFAQSLTAEEFFEHPEVRCTYVVNNYYLFAFGRSFTWYETHAHLLNDDILSSVLADAKLQVSALTALGITERFEDSVRLIYSTMGLKPPETITKLHVTDHFADRDSRFKRVAAVQMTPRLAEAMKALVKYDDALYMLAVSEFEHRLSAQFSQARSKLPRQIGIQAPPVPPPSDPAGYHSL